LLLPGSTGQKRIVLLNDISAALAEEFPEKAISYSSEAYQLAKTGKESERRGKGIENCWLMPPII